MGSCSSKESVKEKSNTSSSINSNTKDQHLNNHNNIKSEPNQIQEHVNEEGIQKSLPILERLKRNKE
jgi:hypothetical protein